MFDQWTHLAAVVGLVHTKSGGGIGDALIDGCTPAVIERMGEGDLGRSQAHAEPFEIDPGKKRRE
jgi:hypothetical protein